jgi:hypothetical protein
MLTVDRAPDTRQENASAVQRQAITEAHFDQEIARTRMSSSGIVFETCTDLSKLVLQCCQLPISFLLRMENLGGRGRSVLAEFSLNREPWATRRFGIKIFFLQKKTEMRKLSPALVDFKCKRPF